MIFDLAIVIPVYNEEQCIVKVVKEWIYMLSDLSIKFKVIVINDGSLDQTKEVLKVFENDNRIDVINKTNSGHGPTILIGYKKSVEIAEWTFQCDSDDEMKPDSFPILWEKRSECDALFGVRSLRDQNFGRKFISAFSRLTVRILFGIGVTDVNTPYRLIRSEILKKIVSYIPNNTFAPNVIISGVICKMNLRTFEHSIIHEKRKTGKVSIVKWKLWKSAAKAFWQTIISRRIIKNIV